MTAWFIAVVMAVKYYSTANDLFMNALTVGLTVFTVINISG